MNHTTTNHSTVCTLHKLELSPIGTQTAALFITINFADDELNIPPGKIIFGVRRGELRFEFEEGAMPFSEREFVSELGVGLSMEHEVTTRRSRQGSITGGLSGEHSQTASLTPSQAAGIKGNLSKSKTVTVEDTSTKKYEDRFSQVSTKGDDTKPVWVFRKAPDEPILHGALNEKRLGLIRLEEGKCKAELGFHVNSSDLIITQAEGLFPQSLTKNTKGIIRAAVLRILRRSYPEQIIEGNFSND